MKRPLLLAAIALLVVSNAFVLAHVAMNRSGEPDSEMELTARELQYYGSRSDDSSVVLMLRWTKLYAQTTLVSRQHASRA